MADIFPRGRGETKEREGWKEEVGGGEIEERGTSQGRSEDKSEGQLLGCHKSSAGSSSKHSLWRKSDFVQIWRQNWPGFLTLTLLLPTLLQKMGNFRAVGGGQTVNEVVKKGKLGKGGHKRELPSRPSAANS